MAPSPPYAPSRRAVKAVHTWANASKEMLKAIQAEGIIVNASDDPPADMMARSHVLAECAIEMTRCMLIYVALITGRDVVETNQELRRREAEVKNHAS